MSPSEENQSAGDPRRFQNVELTIKGQRHTLQVATTWTLKDVLRDVLDLTGTKGGLRLWGLVTFVGDSVAAVVAEDWNFAEEAARAIRVKYEILPAVFDTEAASRDDAPMATLQLPNSSGDWWKDSDPGKPEMLNMKPILEIVNEAVKAAGKL